MSTTDQTLSLDSPLARHPEQAQHIAAVITLWNTSEHILASILALLIGTDPWHAGDILGALASGAAKVDLVESAGRYTLANNLHLLEFEALLKSARSVMRSRHMYAHGIYAVDDKGRLILLRQGKDWFDKSEQKPLGIPQLKQDLQRSEELIKSLMAFHNQLHGEMPQSPSASWLYKAGVRK
jgi:hypothetical protein